MDDAVAALEAVAIEIGAAGDEDDRLIQFGSTPFNVATADAEETLDDAAAENQEQHKSELEPPAQRKKTRRGRRKNSRRATEPEPESEEPLDAGALDAAASVSDERQLSGDARKAARAARKRAAKEQKRNGSTGRKSCGKCSKAECELLIRCASNEWSGWQLVCGSCWKTVSGGVADADPEHPDVSAHQSHYCESRLKWPFVQ